MKSISIKWALPTLFLLTAFAFAKGNNDLIGKWVGKEGDKPLTLQFDRKGDVTVTVGTGENMETRKGRWVAEWSVEPHFLDITFTDGGQSVLRKTLIRFDKGNLLFRDGGSTRPEDMKERVYVFIRSK